MGILDLFKSKKETPAPEPAKKENQKRDFCEFPLSKVNPELAIAEIGRLNAKLKELEYTSHLFMDASKITEDSYVRAEPYTKTGKPNKYPIMMHICSTVHEGYSVSIYYDKKNVASKGSIHIASPKCSYTIDFKNVDDDLKIMKVVTTSDKGNNKLYHVMADGTVFKS